jgi:hypothetical protein
MDLKSAQRKILRICDTQMQKKKLKIGVIEKILDYYLELAECTFARNG